MKNISILGSTGSIGTQALDIIRDKKDSFTVVAMSTNKNIGLFLEQIKEFKPKFVCVYDQASCEKLKAKLKESEWTDGLSTLSPFMPELVNQLNMRKQQIQFQLAAAQRWPELIDADEAELKE